MSASTANIPSVRQNRAPRGTSNRKTSMRRRRIDPKVVGLIADNTLVELGRLKHLQFTQNSLKRFESWIDRTIIEPMLDDGTIKLADGDERRLAAHATAKRLTRGRNSKVGRMTTKTGGMWLYLQERGRQRLVDRAREAHPATGALRTIVEGAA